MKQLKGSSRCLVLHFHNVARLKRDTFLQGNQEESWLQHIITSITLANYKDT